MMTRKNGVGQIIKADIAVVALIALACRFRVIEAALDDLGRLTRWTRHAVGPAQLTDGLIALHIINETLDIDLHHWAPVRGWELRCHQYRTSSYSTTLESNKSDIGIDGHVSSVPETLRYGVGCLILITTILSLRLLIERLGE